MDEATMCGRRRVPLSVACWIGAVALISGLAFAGRDDPSAPDLTSLTFHSRVIESGPVTLENGVYRTSAAPGSASEITAQLTDRQVSGVLDGTPAGAVIVITSTGGSGSFRELALLTETAHGWENTDTVLLGDRVKVRSLAIEGNRIVLGLTVHGPQDPQCCPTQAAERRFAVRDGRLVPVADTGVPLEPQLVGPVWQWVETRYNNDTRAAPPKPENYSIRFREDGGIEVKADCNLKGGSYGDQDMRLSITIITSTMAVCEPDSLEDRFVRDLVAGVIYFFRDGNLYIDLPYDTGTMKFSPAGQD